LDKYLTLKGQKQRNALYHCFLTLLSNQENQKALQCDTGSCLCSWY